MVDPRDASYACEAKKVSYRQTRDGIVVSFVVHPNDVPARMATSPLGTRVMLAVAEIGDDERPVPQPAAAVAPASADPISADVPESRRKTMQQAGILPGQLAFQRFIMGYPPGRTDGPVDGWSTGERKLHAEEALRQRLGIKSRRELAGSDDLCGEFHRLVADFEIACGRRAA